MRYSEGNVSRKIFYDRNISHINTKFGAEGVPPHALTTRASITITNARKGRITNAFVSINRESAATTLKLANAVITKQGGEQYTNLKVINNSVGNYENANAAIDVFAESGNVINCTTEDDGTGGTNAYILVCNVEVFDA